ncbi:hypothetical protein MHU86_14694 [Fragilaria crotonensis]|nr:hypothetical protein MHU86_14694 [Fragilaria crotonensis]
MSTNPQTKQETKKSNDFVIRDGFPALRNEKGEPQIDEVDPLPRAPFLSYTSALASLDEACHASLLEDCAMVFSARTKSDAAAYSAGCTYFAPAAMKPRCALEALALRVFHEHTKDLPKGCFLPEQSGAEWWTLVLNADPPKDSQDDTDDNEDHDEVGMHFDADYGLEDQAPGLLLHPRIATITYLSDIGAPTLVLDRKSLHRMPEELGERFVGDGCVDPSSAEERPHKKQKLEHGGESAVTVPTAAAITLSNEPQQSQRVTFLVNVWLNHCPMDAELLDDDIIDQLKTAPDTVWGLSIDKPDDLAKKSLGVCTRDPAGEEETVICGRIVTLFYNEKMGRQHDVSHSTSCERISLELEFTAGSLRLEVGGPAAENEDDDDADDEDED